MMGGQKLGLSRIPSIIAMGAEKTSTNLFMIVAQMNAQGSHRLGCWSTLNVLLGVFGWLRRRFRLFVHHVVWTASQISSHSVAVLMLKT